MRSADAPDLRQHCRASRARPTSDGLPAEHWDSIYGRKAADQVSWYRPHLDQSLRFVDAAGVAAGSSLIDVGGGASTLGASRVTWIVGDVTRVELPEHAFDFWHDRAVFHFLRDPEDRRRYVASVRRAVKPGGHVLVATFGPEGPERCSGLDVVRYSADGLHAEFGGAFEKLASVTELHTTPSGGHQQFVYCHCRTAS